MKNRIGLSGRANDERDLDPVRRVLTVFVGTCATVLLLAAGSPPLQAQARTAPEDEQAFHRLVDGQRMINTDDLSILAAQNWTEMSDPVRPYVTRLTDGNGLSCGLATQEEMISIREAIDRMSPRTAPSGKYASGASCGQYIRQLHWFHSRGPGSLPEGCRYLVLSADYDGSDRNRSEF